MPWFETGSRPLLSTGIAIDIHLGKTIEMEPLEIRKQQLLQLTDEMLHLLENAEKLTLPEDEGLSRWKSSCKTISEQLSQEVMRVAVVGAIKSGKSTLVNTLLGGDYLKRGAGVVTSIVTRVRTGDCLRAILSLKNWDEINRDVNEASVLLPSDGDLRSFDLRQDADRDALFRALGELAEDQLIVDDTRSPGSVLLSSYLNGYERVEKMVDAHEATVVFENDRFTLHRDFVGDDALAVYLTDLLIEVNKGGLGSNVEVADCQGSDSPNPFHLAMIQDYLAIAHLTVYVISSRTGLRQADIRFLTMIRKMGILDTVVFVVNCDLNEHDSLDSLKRGIRQIESDLKLISKTPTIFTFSSLYTLLSQMEEKLSAKDRNRFSNWQEETEMVDFAEKERERFQHYLNEKIVKERGTLFLKNHLERLEVVSGGISNWVALNSELVGRETDGKKRISEKISSQKDRLDHTKRVLKNTLDGAVIQIKRNLKVAVDDFFNAYDKGVVDGTIRFIRSYQAEMPADDSTNIGFANRLYLVFQAFKQALDAYMAETVNPKIIRFVKEQETMMMGDLDEIAGPYGAMIDESVGQETGVDESVQSEPKISLPPIRIAPELESIRKSAGIALPPAAATMHYSLQIKTEAVMRFGVYKLINFVKNVFKKADDKGPGVDSRALASGVKRMKKETERSILFHMQDYKENIKYQYFLKLADAAEKSLFQQMMERFQYYGSDLSRLVKQVDEQRMDKERFVRRLDRMEKDANALGKRIFALKGELQ
jgi:hypothetical protein